MTAPLLSISPGQANALLRFLGSSQITGAEAPIFMECVFALQMIANHNSESATSEPTSPEPESEPV